MLSCIRVSIPKHPGLREQEEVLRDSSQPFFSFPSFLFILSSLNNSHCLLFSPNVPQKRPTMSDCSHQMDSWMQQVGQMARRPVWCCLLRHGLPFFPGTLSSSEHWVVCSLGAGWKWGAGESLTCIPRGIINYQLPSFLPAPYLEQLWIFLHCCFVRVCWLWWRFREDGLWH